MSSPSDESIEHTTRDTEASAALDAEITNYLRSRRAALWWWPVAGISLLVGLALLGVRTRMAEEESKAARERSEATQRRARELQQASALIGIGAQWARSGRLDSAITAYHGAIALDSANAYAYNLCGYAFLKVGQIDSAKRYLERSVAIDPSYVWGHYNLALAYWRGRDTAATTDQAREAMALSGDIAGTFQRDTQFSSFVRTSQFKAALASSGMETADRRVARTQVYFGPGQRMSVRARVAENGDLLVDQRLENDNSSAFAAHAFVRLLDSSAKTVASFATPAVQRGPKEPGTLRCVDVTSRSHVPLSVASQTYRIEITAVRDSAHTLSTGIRAVDGVHVLPSVDCATVAFPSP